MTGGNDSKRVAARRPHILFVVLDSARPEWLSCCACPRETSPNIDQVAAQAMVFETAISPSSWTFPVMASVFTGMLPAKHGGHDQHLFLDSPYRTMAEIFTQHGYDTAAFADIPYVGPLTKLDRGFRTMSNLQAKEVQPFSKLLKATGRLHRVLSRRYCKTGQTPVVLGEAMHWLTRERDPRKPFLLYIHSDETHAPFLPPGRYRKRFTDLSVSQMHATNKDKQKYVAGLETMTNKERQDLWNLALAEVAYFDEWLGRLFDLLRRQGLYDDTVIVITADHGENMSEHGLLRHAMCLYDTLLHVPLIVKPPGKGGPQKRVPEMVQLIDLLPTLMRMADIKEPEAEAEFQGRDLLARVAQQDFPSFVVSELYPPANAAMWEKKVPHFATKFRERYYRIRRSIRTSTHKYIWASAGEHELYDLGTDPAEECNLIGQRGDLAAELHRQLDHWLAELAPAQSIEGVEATPADNSTDEQVLSRLRDLGYIA